MRVHFIFSVLFLLAGCTTVPVNPRQPASVSHPPFELSDQCRDFLSSLPSHYEYGWVPSFTKPHSDDEVIYIFYYHSRVPGQTPVVVYNGGPQSDSHRLFEKLEFGDSTDFDNPWYVFIDQRGTGCSSAYPNLENRKEYMYWGTEGIVRDSEVVRNVLKIPRWNIFGQSYGAFVVHRYLQMHPEKISTAVAHGGAPLATYSDYNRLRYEQQLFVIKKYFEKYPGDKELVKNIVRKGRCLEDGVLCGGYAIRAISASSMGYSDYWIFIHEKLRSVNSSKIPRVQFSKGDDEGESEDDDYVADIFFWLNAELHGSNSAVNCNKVRRQALTILGAPELFAMSECWGRNGDEGRDGLAEADYKKAIEELKLSELSTKAIKANLEKHPEINFYLFSSELDYYTPPAIVSRAATEMGSRVKYEKLRDTGHEAYLYAPVIRKLLPGLDSFLKSNGQ